MVCLLMMKEFKYNRNAMKIFIGPVIQLGECRFCKSVGASSSLARSTKEENGNIEKDRARSLLRANGNDNSGYDVFFCHCLYYDLS